MNLGRVVTVMRIARNICLVVGVASLVWLVGMPSAQTPVNGRPASGLHHGVNRLLVVGMWLASATTFGMDHDSALDWSVTS